MTSKIARNWFRAHPRNVVTFYRNWANLPAASREILSAPRMATAHRTRVTFEGNAGHTSELALPGVTGWVDGEGQLTLTNAAGVHFITYAAAPERST